MLTSWTRKKIVHSLSQTNVICGRTASDPWDWRWMYTETTTRRSPSTSTPFTPHDHAFPVLHLPPFPSSPEALSPWHRAKDGGSFFSARVASSDAISRHDGRRFYIWRISSLCNLLVAPSIKHPGGLFHGHLISRIVASGVHAALQLDMIIMLKAGGMRRQLCGIRADI